MKATSIRMPVLVALAAICHTPARAADAVADFYQGKTIRMIIRAGWVPDVVSLTRNSRSTADKPIVNTFGRGIVRPSSQRQTRTAENLYTRRV